MPRKTLPSPRPAWSGRRASMRPRPDATENAAGGVAVGQRAVASMRPRPDATENDEKRPWLAALRGASMRPRPDATENVHLEEGVGWTDELQ